MSFLNLYDDYQQLIFAPYRKNGLQDYLKGISGQMTIEENRNTGDVRVYINDIYRFYIHFFNNGNISYINFLIKIKSNLSACSTQHRAIYPKLSI